MPALYGLLIFALSYQRGVVHWVQSSRIASLGAISFPLYLIHVIAIFWLDHLISTGVIDRGRPTVLLLLGSCFAVATMLHIVVERPVQRAARRWMQRSPARV